MTPARSYRGTPGVRRLPMAPAMNLPPLNFAIQALDEDGTLTTLASSIDATVAYLEHLVQGFQDAINNRVLSNSAPAWQHLSDRYEMGSKLPLYIDSLKTDGSPPLGREENLRELSRCCSTFPDYRIEFSRKSTEVDEDKGRAKTLAVLKVAGELSLSLDAS